MAPDLTDPGIKDIYASLVRDKDRNDLIFHDLLKLLEMGSSPLVLTERVEHLELIASRLKGSVPNVIVMKGGTGSKERKALIDRIRNIPDKRNES